MAENLMANAHDPAAYAASKAKRQTIASLRGDITAMKVANIANFNQAERHIRKIAKVLEMLVERELGE